MSKVHIDRVRTNDQSDAFALVGCKNMCLRLLRVSMADMLLSEGNFDRDASAQWFDPKKSESYPFAYEECMAVIGYSSRIESFRNHLLSGDVTKIKSCVAFIDREISSYAAMTERVHASKKTEIEGPQYNSQFHDLTSAFSVASNASAGH